MDIEELNKLLKDRAIELNACYKGVSRMDKILDVQELIDLWKRHIDFAIDKDFPSVDFMKRNGDKELMHRNLVYVDEQVSMYKKSGIAILNGTCTGAIAEDGFDALRVYIRHNCNIVVKAGGMAKVFIDVHDNAKVHVMQGEASCVYVYLHDNATETHEGNVIVRKKTS